MADDVTSKGQGGRLPSRYQDPFQSFRTDMDRLFDSFLGGAPSLTSLRHKRKSKSRAPNSRA
jgi:HSP20 family protein